MSSSSLLEARAKRHALRLYHALAELLEDTQHSEHHCGGDGCPVEEARALLAEIDGKPAKIPVNSPHDCDDPTSPPPFRDQKCRCTERAAEGKGAKP